VGDSYCNDAKREYYHSWRKYSRTSFKTFLRAKDAYGFYHRHPDIALKDAFGLDGSGKEKDSYMWARIYSENVEHKYFEPISDDTALREIDRIRASGEDIKPYAMALIFGLGVKEWMSQDEGGGGIGGNTGLRFGSHHSETKWANQMANRGWTTEEIYEAVKVGQSAPVINQVNPGNAATIYYHPVTGRAVVVDNVTNEILHIGGDNFNYSNWLLK
jgi:hypothetical protein